MPFLQLPEARLHYLVEDRAGPRAPWLVLSNSLGTTSAMWDLQVAAWQDAFRILRYDTRGHGASVGASARLAKQVSLAELAADVLALMDHLHIERANFCGLSMGGMTGLWLAAHAPQRIERLAACNTAAQIGPVSIWDSRIATVEAQGMASIVPAVIARWFTARFAAEQPEAVAPIQAMLMACPVAGYVAACGAIRDADLHPVLARITRPTLVVVGRHDLATTPAQGETLRAALADARLFALDAAHLSNIEASDPFNTQVRQFFLEQGHG